MAKQDIYGFRGVDDHIDRQSADVTILGMLLHFAHKLVNTTCNVRVQHAFEHVSVLSDA